MNKIDKEIAFFDFDGTITFRDSLFCFLWHSFSLQALIWKSILFFPTYIYKIIGFLDSSSAKEKLFIIFFSGMREDKFESLAFSYVEKHLDKIINKTAIDRILWHQTKGHEVVVVSASPDNWLHLWCEKYNLGLISTKLGKENDYITGFFLSVNCNGMEKKRRILNKYNLANYATIYCYGNSRGDNDMLSLATYSYYKFF